MRKILIMPLSPFLSTLEALFLPSRLHFPGVSCVPLEAIYLAILLHAVSLISLGIVGHMIVSVEEPSLPTFQRGRQICFCAHEPEWSQELIFGHLWSSSCMDVVWQIIKDLGRETNSILMIYMPQTLMQWIYFICTLLIRNYIYLSLTKDFIESICFNLQVRNSEVQQEVTSPEPGRDSTPNNS